MRVEPSRASCSVLNVGDKPITRLCLPRLTACAPAVWNLIVGSPTDQSNDLRPPKIIIMSQFRAAKLDIGCFINIRNIRDHTKRKVYAANEPERYAPQDICIECAMTDRNFAHSQALRYIIRNTTLPQRVRAQAQLQLSQMHCYTRFTQVKNRCIMGGKGRGVFSDFRLGRVRHTFLTVVPRRVVSHPPP